MPVGIRNGTELAYDLREVAAFLGYQDIGCENGQAFMQQLGDYFRQHNLIELFNKGGGRDSVTLGSVRAFCIDHGVSIPETIAGPASTQELAAIMRKMQVGVEVAQIASIPDRPAKTPHRKHGGSRPESIFVEEYVRGGREANRTTENIKLGIVPHILKCIEEGDLDCPFTEFDAVNKRFSVNDAKGRTRWCSVANLNRAVTAALKRIKK